MIPVSDMVRKLLIQAVESTLEQFDIEASMPQADRGLNDDVTDDQYTQLIEQYKVIRTDLMDNRLVIFDMKPQCTMSECEAEGRYSPIIFVYLPNTDAPCAQLDVQPPQWCCTQHANGQLDKYLTKPQWRDIQAQVQKQTGQLIRFGDAKIMYMDRVTQSVVPPPNPAIVLVDGSVN